MNTLNLQESTYYFAIISGLYSHHLFQAIWFIKYDAIKPQNHFPYYRPSLNTQTVREVATIIYIPLLIVAKNNGGS